MSEHPQDETSRDEPPAPEQDTAEQDAAGLDTAGPRADVRRRTATVRGIELGRARPEIIVPLVGAYEDEPLAQAEAAVGTAARLMEWRLDRFRPGLEDTGRHREAARAGLPGLRAPLGPDRAHLRARR